MNSLSLDMRPSRLEEVVGCTEIKAAIQKQMVEGRVARVYLLSGPLGTGKTTLALILARMVQGDYPEHDPIEVIEHNAGEFGKVEPIRELVQSCTYRPFSGRYRVVILNEAQQMTDHAQNVLLQPFEETEAATIYILTTTEPDEIIAALRSRCTHFRLRGLDATETKILVERAANRIKATHWQVDTFVAGAISAGIQSSRVLLQSFEQYVSGLPLSDCFDSSAANPLLKDIALAVLKGDWNTTRNMLAQIQTQDARGVRSIVSGFLRSALLKEPIGSKADAISVCLVGLGSAAFEDGVAWATTCGLLYKTCKAIGGAR